MLLSCQNLGKAHGTAPLFEGLSFGLSEGDHVGLVGPNGAGKSTLLKILAGLEAPSSGTRAARQRLRLGYVPQDPTFAPGGTIGSVLDEALRDQGLREGERERRLARTLGRAGFEDAERPVADLSGGFKKRLSLACALVREPELLLLDEPTNHLDVDGILWLEEALRRDPEAFLVVSHDRYFLEAICGRMLEINRAFALGFLDVRGGYREYLERKDALLSGQASYQDSLRNRVRGELEWLSRKAKARTRKAQARIDEAGRLHSELRDLDDRSRSGAVAIDFSGTERKTKRLLVAEGVEKTFGDRVIVRRLDLVLSPGMRIGLLGANGSGKSTLLRLLAGLEAPDAGQVVRAPKLQIVTFDQHRTRLDPEVSLKRTLAPHGDSVIFRGSSVHVAGWARRFLFRSEQLETPVGRLSGGEQARVLVARLMLEPADVLLLDEPTNDLDIDTLEVLEESLLAFEGALVLVTHDRYLLDRVSNRLLALDGNGGIVPYADYAQWEATRGEGARAVAAASLPSDKEAPAAPPPRAKRLGYLEQREWEGIEALVQEAESRVDAFRAAAADPLMMSDHAALRARLEALAAAEVELDRLVGRWAELEARVKT